ncbi:MAG: hypothetical protein MdMp014T_0035 [Treponematales bacterium]|jgi:hypothetical protein
MKRYRIKCRPGRVEFIDILRENDDGFTIKLTKLSGGDERTSEEFMPRRLFALCMKMGYLFETGRAECSVA